MQEEIQQLTLLASLDRIRKEEQARLGEYQRLLDKILVLPGFEFTATFGFHILGIFPPEKPVREIELLLLTLNVPADQLDKGSASVGATADVLTAYRAINLAGGLAIAAHANSSNGVAMRGFSFGGQTKIAYTQDANLHALEVTDLAQQGRRTTAGFFNGSKPEYPRRMHTIQGSDAHRLTAEGGRGKNLGVGDRVTEALLPEVSFNALKALFLSNDFARTRPRHKKAEPVYDFIRSAQEEGANIVQDFHENMGVRGGNLYNIIANICAFANTNGGTLYIGIPEDHGKPVPGVPRPAQAIEQLEKEISNRITPPLACSVNTHSAGDKKILRVLIPRGDDPPYAVDDNKIYVRSETETSLAVRDEIVALVRGAGELPPPPAAESDPAKPPAPGSPAPPAGGSTSPRTGVEVVAVEERKGARYYTLRDLRNNSVVKNVTKTSARRLWGYALTAYEKLPKDPEKSDIQWKGDYGLIRHQQQGQLDRYDLIQRVGRSAYRYFFGVTEDGIHGEWSALVGGEESE
jgi:hypothetical protein